MYVSIIYKGCPCAPQVLSLLQWGLLRSLSADLSEAADRLAV